MSIFDPKPPEELEPETEYVALLTWTEMFCLNAIMSAMKPGAQREAKFMELIQHYGLPADPPGEIELVISIPGMDSKPPKRLMTLAEYTEYFQENMR